MIKRRSPDEIEKLAKALYKNEIFTNRHIKKQEDITKVFLAFALMGPDDLRYSEAMDIGLIYEWVSQAGPTSINGMPMFMSYHLLGKADTDLVLKRYTEIRKLLGDEE